MDSLITVLHIVACFVLVLVVLLQHGKGADIGAAFGAGASNTVFGARGAGNFLTKFTTGTVVVFMLTSLTLSYFSGGSDIADLAPTLESSSPPEAVEPLETGTEEGGTPSGFEVVPSGEEAAPETGTAPVDPTAAGEADSVE